MTELNRDHSGKRLAGFDPKKFCNLEKFCNSVSSDLCASAPLRFKNPFPFITNDQSCATIFVPSKSNRNRTSRNPCSRIARRSRVVCSE